MTLLPFAITALLLTVVFIVLLWRLNQLKNREQKSMFSFLERYLHIFYGVFIVLASGFFILFTYKLFHINSEAPKTEQNRNILDFLTEHVDYSGLIIGIIGIIIGLITVIYVEKQNAANEERVKSALKRLNKATHLIHQNITNLNEVSTITEIFKKCRGIIKHADNNSNHLYILTHFTDFGHFFIRNYGILTRESNLDPDDYARLNQMQFYEQCMTPFIQLKERFNNQLQKYVNRNTDLHLAVLRNEKINPKDPDKLRPFIRDSIINGKQVKLINKNSTQQLNCDIYNDEDIYLHHPLSVQRSPEYIDFQEVLVKDILECDSSFIESLKAHSKGILPIQTLENIPFQFFISAPKKENDDYKWKGIIIFSNYSNLGYENSVVGFCTQNPTLCKGLKTMYHKLLDAQKKKDSQPMPMKKLFAGCSTIHIVLKNVKIENEDVVNNIGFRYVTPVPDISAKDQLLNLLKDSDVKCSHTAMYIEKNTEEAAGIISNTIPDKTFISLGLFHNPITEGLSRLSENAGNALFRMENRSTSDGKNRILIATGGSVTAPEFTAFEEVFDETKETSFDYAIFCRLRVNNQWIFAGGGLNFFGSRYFTECMKYASETLRSEEILSSSFIALFQVNSVHKINPEANGHSQDDSILSSIRLLHTSYVAGNKIVCTTEAGSSKAKEHAPVQPAFAEAVDD